MSLATLERLVAGERALIAALDGDDPQAIADRCADLAHAIAALGAIPADATPLAEQAMALADDARARINTLSDTTQRRLAALSAATGRGRAGATYGRDARMSR